MGRPAMGSQLSEAKKKGLCFYSLCTVVSIAIDVSIAAAATIYQSVYDRLTRQACNNVSISL